MRRRPTVIALAAVAAAVVLAGCSTDGEEAVETTDETSATTTTATPQAPSAAEIVRHAASAPSQFDTSEIEMVIEVDGEQIMGVAGTASADGTSGDMTMSGPTGDMRMLYVDGAYYYQFPDLPEGIEWVSMSFDEVAASTGIDPSAAPGMEGTSMLEVLTTVSDDLEELGTDELFGVAVTGYRASLSSDALIANGVDAGLYQDGMVEQMRELLPEQFEMDVWIDDDGLPRRQAWSMEMATVPGAAPSTFSYRFDFPSWGGPLEVTAPPADRVATMEDLMGAAAEG